MNTLPPHLAQEFKSSIDRMVRGKTNLATERAHIKDALEESGYKPEPGQEGTLYDFGFNDRIELILKTNVEMIRCRRQMIEGCEEGALDAYPAQELINVAPDEEPYAWEEIWNAAAAGLGKRTRATNSSSGFMIALKSDPIWVAISDFSLPHPPFKFFSFMGVEDVDYQQAVELRVMDENEELPPLKFARDVPLVGFDIVVS
jgi:hypothetical protein